MQQINTPGIVIQKSGGRLRDPSLAWLTDGATSPIEDVDVQIVDLGALNLQPVYRAQNYDLQLRVISMRDDDIPPLVAANKVQFGIVGGDVVREWQLENAARNNDIGEVWRAAGREMAQRNPFNVLGTLGFGDCDLKLALPKELAAKCQNGESWETFIEGKRVATSYPFILQNFLREKGVRVKEVVTLSGNVEVSYSAGMADAVCDLVASGKTLAKNGLAPVCTVMSCQAELVGINPDSLTPVMRQRQETYVSYFQELLRVRSPATQNPVRQAFVASAG